MLRVESRFHSTTRHVRRSSKCNFASEHTNTKISSLDVSFFSNAFIFLSFFQSYATVDNSIAEFIEQERKFVPGIDYVERFQSHVLDASVREESVSWILKVNRVTGSKTVIEPSLNKGNMAVKRHGHLSGIPNVLYEPNKQKAVKEHADTPNDLNKSILKKRKTMEGQGLESEISEDLYEPISKKRKMERHVPSEVPKDFNVFIPKKRRTVKERGLPSKEPKDLYELYNGYPSEIPRNLYDNAVKGLGLVSDIPEALYMLVKRAVAIRKYLETNEGNRILNLRLQCAERCIDTHSRYLKYAKQLPRDWKYHPYFWKV